MTAAATAGRPEEGTSSGEDEAEFAWLPMDCLKPFQPGDTCGAADGSEPDDLNLRACVGAANKAVLLLQSRLDERNAAAAAAGDELLVAEEDSDSDGGQSCNSIAHLCTACSYSWCLLYQGTPRERDRAR